MKYRRWKNLFLGVLIVVLFFPIYSKIQQLKLKDKALSLQLEQVIIENKYLTEEIVMLKTDPVYIEEVARDTLKVAGKNEIIFRVLNDVEE